MCACSDATQQTSMTASASIDKSYLATLASWLALLVEKEDDNVQREVIRSSLLRPSPQCVSCTLHRGSYVDESRLSPQPQQYRADRAAAQAP